ncbi:MAG: hypothetical protein HHJ16_00265 [Polaromonas sp.]|uniref:hypothetical protein n=1 Tax=Polaromonas sp. TaxID=1869339 RepID=UPI0017CA699E|nr:hypothetical protein [Polaromonas sp.]NMM08698.1 hypothetical protein [Polaromonas sp.]
MKEQDCSMKIGLWKAKRTQGGAGRAPAVLQQYTTISYRHIRRWKHEFAVSGSLLIAMGLKAVSWRDALQALAIVPFNAAIRTWLLPTKTLQPSLACGGGCSH